MQKRYLSFLFCFLALSLCKAYSATYPYSITETEYALQANDSPDFLQLEINKQDDYTYTDYSQRKPFEEFNIVTTSSGGWDPKPGEPEWEDTPVGSGIICFFLFIGIYLVYIHKKRQKA